MTLVNAVLAALLATAALAAEPQRRPTAHNNGLVSWAEVIECYRSPQTAIQCLETRMGRSLVSLRDTAVGMARSDPDTATEDIAGVGDLVQQIGEFISYSLATYFHSEEDDTAAGVASSDGTANANGGQMDGEEGQFRSTFCIYILLVICVVVVTVIGADVRRKRRHFSNFDTILWCGGHIMVTTNFDC